VFRALQGHCRSLIFSEKKEKEMGECK